ncbi:MAG: hypothetical protein HC838_13475 [Spirulinaceae cyanobacterium RM2_2_10]|nr:hypothetical protein [Spirulinaceae cyanobacterium RM2_2_10]
MPQLLPPALQKYRTLLIAITLFLCFDLGVLVPNFILSSRIKQDAIAINLAGRQRMLSQRTVKSLFQLQIARETGIGEPETARRELETTYQLFDETLQGFARGRTVTGGDGEPVFLPAATSPRAQELVQAALAIWQPYRDFLLPVLEARPDSEALVAAIDYAQEHNLILLDLMNQMWVRAPA